VDLEKNAKGILDRLQNQLAQVQRTLMTTLRQRQKNGWDMCYVITKESN